jgi:hypothetical protein
MIAALAALVLSATDLWGVQEIRPTIAGGREWFLPETADAPDATWRPESAAVLRIPGGWHTCGATTNGETRLNVTSPAGAAWWRNVEATAYARRFALEPASTQRPHVELVVRGERHSAIPFAPSAYNLGVPAPAGTVTPPGWPWATEATVNPHCAGTGYHANFYDGQVLFEKELSHSEGYGSQRGSVSVPGLSLDNWNGFKALAYNSLDGAAVHLEAWVDLGATGTWTKVASVTDTTGWPATTLEGCDAAPYGYSRSMPITWAGPWVLFRADAMALDFRWLSVREIAPR